jgi:hypothetical protein
VDGTCLGQMLMILRAFAKQWYFRNHVAAGDLSSDFVLCPTLMDKLATDVGCVTRSGQKNRSPLMVKPAADSAHAIHKVRQRLSFSVFLWSGMLHS